MIWFKHLYRYQPINAIMPEKKQSLQPSLQQSMQPSMQQSLQSTTPNLSSVNQNDIRVKLGEDLLFEGPETFKMEVNEKIKDLENKLEKQNKDMMEMFKMLKKIHNFVFKE